MAEDRSSTLKTDRNVAHWAGRTVALVGLMGAGKSTVGKRLATKLGRTFFDSDYEIEKAAGLPVRVEQRVLERLLSGPPHVLATGGGAYLNAQTRETMRNRAITVWLNADLETLWKRVSKRSHRPLLKTENPKEVLTNLLEARRPIYELADLTVDSIDGPHSKTVEAIISTLDEWTLAEND